MRISRLGRHKVDFVKSGRYKCKRRLPRSRPAVPRRREMMIPRLLEHTTFRMLGQQHTFSLRYARLELAMTRIFTRYIFDYCRDGALMLLRLLARHLYDLR